MASFSFSFSGDDIEDDSTTSTTQDAAVAPSVSELQPQQTQGPTVTPAAAAAPAASAFPVQGKPQLPPQRHDLKEMLSKLPSKIAYSLLDVTLDSRVDGDATTGGSTAPREAPFRIRLPRRELWDVKVQLMAEEDEEDGDSSNNGSGELAPGLGTHDVKTGIYEGGFKSWESSVDLVKVLLQPPPAASDSLSTPAPSDVAGTVLLKDGPAHVIEVRNPLSSDFYPRAFQTPNIPNSSVAVRHCRLWLSSTGRARRLVQPSARSDEATHCPSPSPTTTPASCTWSRCPTSSWHGPSSSEMPILSSSRLCPSRRTATTTTASWS